MSKAKIGDYILIKNMKDEFNFKPIIGRVLHIDSIGQIHGTWSGFAVIPEVDDYDVLSSSRYELFKLAEEKGSRLYGINTLVDFYVKSLNWSEEEAIKYTFDLFKNGTIKEIEILGGKN